ncbi:Thermostable carboxypeptidase 1 [Coccomyxa sp. Obi]|nr:Thermostable carboxypeptidase 1 [Coccomyxa sp. Obi]
MAAAQVDLQVNTPVADEPQVVVAPKASSAPHTAKQDYDMLCEKLKEISTLSGISGLLGWDEMVMMPNGAAACRAAQKAAMAGILYDKQTSPELGNVLQKLEGAESSNDFDPFQRAVIREARRDWVRTVKIPKRIAKRRAELESEGYQAWVTARSEKDFSKFAPVLEEWVALVRESSQLVDPSRPAYDVALEEFEKGMTAARLDEVFTQVREGLVPLIAAIREKGTPPDTSVLQGTFDTDAQATLCNSIAKELGFNLDCGRLDVSVHPFTGGSHPTDVRMTTRFKDNDLTEGLTGAIHETGHALYEQGRNLAYDGLPVNQALSMGVHESQSLLWERMVALSLPFSRYLAPKLTAAFPQLANLQAEQLYRALNAVKKESMIRVEADEVTYPLHIILRYELEKELVEGSVKVEQLPKLWNERMASYLGCTPADDAQGVLQDVHWSAGLFGYFPTYTLGAMFACQIYQAAQKDLPGLAEDIAAGKFGGLKAWLNEKIHASGSLHPSGDELMIAATGSPLDPSIFLSYLTDKYSALYKL